MATAGGSFADIRTQVFRYSGIQVFYCIIAFETAMRQQNFAKQKDSNKKINAKPDNKAEDHKREKLITSQESSLCRP